MPSKYGNKITEIDGHTFASLAEARRYQELTWMQAAGSIAALRLQPRFPLVVNGVKVCTYIGDFAYVEVGNTAETVEDVKSKGTITAVYRLKRKLMLACHGIKIVEVMM